MANEECRRVRKGEAIALGLIYYFGRPCLHGHDGQRLVVGGHCVHCKRGWAKARRKKPGVKERIEANARDRYAKNPERYRAKASTKYQNDKERIKDRRRKYHYVTYEDENVRERAQERTRQWALDNPERAKLNSKVSKHRRRARERSADGSFTADDVKTIFKSQCGRCAYCPKRLGRGYHVDHVVPLARGGSNGKKNLQLLCKKCNLSKGSRDPVDHARSIGKLL